MDPQAGALGNDTNNSVSKNQPLSSMWGRILFGASLDGFDSALGI